MYVYEEPKVTSEIPYKLTDVFVVPPKVVTSTVGDVDVVSSVVATITTTLCVYACITVAE